jgi:iron complex outermembrane receptor protein
VSSLPVIHGLADERLRIQVDGMDLMAACPNHMNSPLSYIDASNVGQVRVFAGITPVSVGGDSLGGTVQVESAAPEFAAPGQAWLAGQWAASTAATAVAGRRCRAAAGRRAAQPALCGSSAQSDNYHAAAAFKPAATTGSGALAGDELGSSAFRARNQLSLALRQDAHCCSSAPASRTSPSRATRTSAWT